LLPEAVRVLITVAYLRQICSQNVLSELLEINPNSIGRAIADSRQLLREHGHTITPTTMRLSTASALLEFLITGAMLPPDPRCPRRWLIRR
jgi:hypothetical protein